MKCLRLSLLATSLSLACALAHAQDTAIVVEAETANPLGAQLSTATDASNVGYITLNGPTIGGGSPPTADRVATLAVTFPAPGRYQLYMRMWVGPTNGGAEDDSFFYGNGFGAKALGNADEWITANQLGGARGYTNPTDKVVGGGLAGTQVWKWLNLSVYSMDEPGHTFEVTAGNLSQTIQLAGREDGFRIDKIAFGREGLFFTVNQLDNGLPGSTEPPPPPFDPPGPPIATGLDKFLGSAHSPAQAEDFEKYWNKVTPENGGKWGSVEGTRDVMNWTELDAAWNVAQANGFPFHHHVLIWGNQQPNWIAALPQNEQLEEIQEWFSAVAARYPNIDIVEVFNEPLHDLPDDPADGGYYAALGGAGVTGWDGVIKAFEMARATFPNSKLMLNDFSITNTDSSTTTYLQIINLLKERNLIDIIGVQGHAFSTTPNIPNQTHINNLNRLAATGLPIHVTEFDVDGLDDDEQLQQYQRIFPIFWEHPGVEGITLWGFRPGHWRSAQGAYIVLDNGAERPSMVWLQNYVRDKVPVVVPGQTINVAENTAAGTQIGTVAATDEDEDASLAEWQITGGSGASLFTIDALSGAVSIASGATLDFESAASYTINVSVHDGFRRSVAEAVTIQLGNSNDNTPVVTAGQRFRIDDGSRNVIGPVAATDADDTNQPGFTTFQGWQVTGGNAGSIFRVDPATGVLRTERPLQIDFRRSSYTVQLRTSDGANTSATQSVTVTIPNNLRICQFGFFDLVAPKQAAPLLLRLGGTLGRCRAN